MAIARFGNFQVDMTTPEFDPNNPDFLNATIGTNIDGDPSSVSATSTAISGTFPTGWVVIYRGNFTLGVNSPITGFEIDKPGHALVFSVTKIAGLTVDTLQNSTDDQLNALVFGQVTEVFTQGFDDTLIGGNSSETAHSGGGNDII